MDSSDQMLSPIYADQHDSDASPRTKRKKRVRNWTAKDRAEHRVSEKGRREAFNGRLMELASLLPALRGTKDGQLSKHVIVDESIKLHRSQLSCVEKLTHDIVQLREERDRLLAELNAFRQSINQQAHQAPSPAFDIHMNPNHAADSALVTDMPNASGSNLTATVWNDLSNASVYAGPSDDLAITSQTASGEQGLPQADFSYLPLVDHGPETFDWGVFDPQHGTHEAVASSSFNFEPWHINPGMPIAALEAEYSSQLR